MGSSTESSLDPDREGRFHGRYEGIRPLATFRHPLLSLEDDDQEVRRAIMNLAHHTYMATMVANPAPATAELWRRMHIPQVGDLVMEMTTFRRMRSNTGDWHRGLGFLLALRNEWMNAPEEWAEIKNQYAGERRPAEEVWYVQYGPDRQDICRWTNCRFIAIPIGDNVYHG